MDEQRLTGAITLPDGTVVRGRGRRESLPPGLLPTYGLYLGSQGTPRLFSRAPAWQPDWPADWVDWPDFRTPRDGVAAAALIGKAYRLAACDPAGERVEVACTGGTGRTGTVLACMAILAGHPAGDAVAWVRRHYRSRAVETRGQRRWVTWFADHADRA